MARRSDHTREELMHLAVRLGGARIEAQGYAHFSARALAQDMGYSVGTLSHVFGNIDGLILQINANTLDFFYDFIVQRLEHARADSDPLRSIAFAYLAFAREHRFRWLALYEHAPIREVPDWYLDKLARFFTLVEQALNRETPEQAITPAMQRSARLLWAGVHGICLLSLTEKLALTGISHPARLILEFLAPYRSPRRVISAHAARI